MEPTTVILITKQCITFITDKKKRKAIIIIIAFLILLPIILITILIIVITSIFTTISPDEIDIFQTSITELKADYKIENNVNPELIRAISFIDNYKVLGSYFETRKPDNEILLNKTKEYIFSFCIGEQLQDANEQQIKKQDKKYFFL